MLKVNLFIVTLASFFVLNSSSSWAFNQYNETAFNTNIYSGKMVLVLFESDKCEICNKQSNTASQLLTNPRFKDITIFNVDFESAKSIVKKFHVAKTGTIILMKGTTEVFRTSSPLEQNKLAAEIEKTMK